MTDISDIACVLQELSDEEVYNCIELESDSDLSDEHIDYDNFNSDSVKNFKKYMYKNKILFKYE